jgi:hypothetical protein
VSKMPPTILSAPYTLTKTMAGPTTFRPAIGKTKLRKAAFHLWLQEE